MLQIVEIRLHSGLLLIGKPGAIPAVMLKASDEQKLKIALRTLALDSTAMTQVRRHWRKLLPAQSSTALTGTELARRLRSEIAAGRLAAVLLSEAPDVIEPAQLRNSSSAVVHVPMKNATLLLAPKGKLPPDLARQAVKSQTSVVLRQLDPASPSSRTLDRYAHRLPDSAIKQVSGSQLCHYVAWQVEAGGYDSALLSTPMSRTLAAARPEAPIAVSQMSRTERIAEALSRCRRHEMTPAIRAAVEQMIEPENLAIMVAVLAAVALAQTNPATGAAVNTTLVAVAWINTGITGVMAIADLIVATGTAITAEHEIDLDAAAKLYASAFVALGASLISALVAKFAPKRAGDPKKAANNARGSKGAVPSGQNRNSQATAGSHNQSGTSKSPPRFGSRSKATEPGARPADAKTLREIRRAKLRGDKALSQQGWPDIPGRDVSTFKAYPEAVELKPGQKIYRVIDQESNPNGGYWTVDNPAT